MEASPHPDATCLGAGSLRDLPQRGRSRRLQPRAPTSRQQIVEPNQRLSALMEYHLVKPELDPKEPFGVSNHC